MHELEDYAGKHRRNQLEQNIIVAISALALGATLWIGTALGMLMYSHYLSGKAFEYEIRAGPLSKPNLFMEQATKYFNESLIWEDQAYWMLPLVD